MILFNPDVWRRALRDPVIALALGVDLLPVIGVLVYGWGAAPLVMLYWLENLIIGAATLIRILVSGFQFGGPVGLLTSSFLAAFFTLHYGLFCLVHGVFLIGFLPGLDIDQMATPSPEMLSGMVQTLLAQWPGLSWIVAAYIFWHGLNLTLEMVDLDVKNRGDLVSAMFAPYGRIVVMHIGIFAGAYALVALGDPMAGVLALISLKAVVTLAWNIYRRYRREKLHKISLIRRIDFDRRR